MRTLFILLLAATALLTGGGALYLTGLIFTSLDQFHRITILLPLMALSIGNALFICLFCVARLFGLRHNVSRTPGRLQTQTVRVFLGLIALTLGLPSVYYLANGLITPDPGLRLIFLPIAAPGLAIAAICLWRIAALHPAP